MANPVQIGELVWSKWERAEEFFADDNVINAGDHPDSTTSYVVYGVVKNVILAMGGAKCKISPCSTLGSARQTSWLGGTRVCAVFPQVASATLEVTYSFCLFPRFPVGRSIGLRCHPLAFAHARSLHETPLAISSRGPCLEELAP